MFFFVQNYHFFFEPPNKVQTECRNKTFLCRGEAFIRQSSNKVPPLFENVHYLDYDIVGAYVRKITIIN